MTVPLPVAATLRAEFNPLIRPYLVLYGAWVMVMTIVGIPLALIWVCGLGQWWARHYYDRLECELGVRELRFRKGILFQVEKTIPLENIQDVTFIEGPVLRRFNLSVLKFETAGQSMGQAHDMRLVGIVDAQAFRAQILERRQAARLALAQPGAPAAPGDGQLEVLQAISARLDEIATLLRERRP
jgi:membrane protein YdbS with pleckstrin-like domain